MQEFGAGVENNKLVSQLIGYLVIWLVLVIRLASYPVYQLKYMLQVAGCELQVKKNLRVN